MKKAFDGTMYIESQAEMIRQRLDKFPRGKLYFEVGGKFLYDGHAERVLPGYDPESKIKILQSFDKDFEIIFCISSPDIQNKRIWKQGENYQQSVLSKLTRIESKGLPKPHISVNLYQEEADTKEFILKLQSLGYKCFNRYFIEGYPENVDAILSPEGYGKDDYIPTNANFIVVMGLGSNTGKMSTCLGQIYHDKLQGLDSGYAKYETFPVWNLPLKHPINLAYEAATADIGDYNLYDPFYEAAYGKKAVNYNRDVEAFPILKNIIEKVTSAENYMRSYKSPTDMGVNTVKASLIDEEIAIQASIEEIKRRIERYQQEYKAGTGQLEWVESCEKILEKALSYGK
jgi:uncharacterized protein (UPF0371 family)